MRLPNHEPRNFHPPPPCPSLPPGLLEIIGIVILIQLKWEKLNMVRGEVEQWVETHTVFNFSRARGPGGQNVNKVNTKVTAKLSIKELAILKDHEKDRIRERLQNKINAQDEIVVSAQRARTQYRNRKIALNKMSTLVLFALQKSKKRIASKPSHASAEKRLRQKHIVSEKKRQRQYLGVLDM